MAINTSIADLKWLGQPADPGRSLAQGVQAGSQIAGNLLRGFAQKAQQDEFAQQQALREKNDAIEREATQQKMQLTTQAAAERAKIQAIRTEGLAEFANDSAELAKQYPDGIVPPEKLQSAMARRSAKIFASSESALGTFLNKGVEDDIRQQLADQKLTNVALEKKFAPSDRQKANEEMIQAEVDDRAAKGLPPMSPAEMASLRKSVVASSFPSKDNVESTSMGFDSEGKGYLKITKGGKDTNIATENKAQMQLMQDEKLSGQLLGLRNNLRWQDVGIAGTAGEFLGDRVLPQLGFDTADPTRQANRVELKSAMIAAYSSLKADPRTSNYDKAQMDALGPSDKWAETPERARIAARTLNDIVKDRAQVSAKMANKPTEDWMLTQKDIANEVEKGTMPTERAFDLRVKYYPDTLSVPEIQQAVKSKKMSEKVGIHLVRTLYPDQYH